MALRPPPAGIEQDRDIEAALHFLASVSCDAPAFWRRIDGQRQSGWPVERHSSWPVGRGWMSLFSGSWLELLWLFVVVAG